MNFVVGAPGKSMKVLIDTSAWVDFLNGYESLEGMAVCELLKGEDEVCTCGVVVAEVFQGLRGNGAYNEIASLFSEMTFLQCSGISSYFKTAELYRTLRKRGVTVRSTIDCLITILAADNGCRILARDRDIAAIVSSGALKLNSWGS